MGALRAFSATVFAPPPFGGPWGDRNRPTPRELGMTRRAAHLLGLPPEAHGPPAGGGKYTREEARGVEYLPGCSHSILPDGPPSLGRTRFFYSQSVWMIVACKLIVLFLHSYMLSFKHAHVFFSEIVLRRNQIIKEVVLVEASSILPLPR